MTTKFEADVLEHTVKLGCGGKESRSVDYKNCISETVQDNNNNNNNNEKIYIARP